MVFPLIGKFMLEYLFSSVFFPQCYPCVRCLQGCLQGWKVVVKIRPFRQGFVGTGILFQGQCPAWRESLNSRILPSCASHKTWAGFSHQWDSSGCFFSFSCCSLHLYHTPSNTTHSLTYCRPTAFHPHLSLSSRTYLVKPYLRDRHLF